MRFGTRIRVLRDKLSGRPRELYWGYRTLAAELAATLNGARRPFRAHVIRDGMRYAIGAVCPISGETEMSDALANRSAADPSVRVWVALVSGIGVSTPPCWVVS